MVCKVYRDPQVLLTYEAKRRPEVAAWIAQIDTLSPTAIEALDVPLPWMRQALLALKESRRLDGLKALLAASDDWVIEGRSPDPMGVMREWTGMEAYVRVGRGEILVTYGQLLWLNADGIWLDTVHTTHVDPKLHANTVSRGAISRAGYMQAVRNRLSGGVFRDEVAQPKPLFTVFRPGQQSPGALGRGQRW
jgi:hypothetical protein